MQKLIQIIFVVTPMLLSAQNLIPNPGFEDVIECPYAYPVNQEIYFAEPWIPVRSVDVSTSDLFNDCVWFPGNDPWGN